MLWKIFAIAIIIPFYSSPQNSIISSTSLTFFQPLFLQLSVQFSCLFGKDHCLCDGLEGRVVLEFEALSLNKIVALVFFVWKLRGPFLD